MKKLKTISLLLLMVLCVMFAVSNVVYAEEDEGTPSIAAASAWTASEAIASMDVAERKIF